MYKSQNNSGKGSFYYLNELLAILHFVNVRYIWTSTLDEKQKLWTIKTYWIVVILWVT